MQITTIGKYAGGTTKSRIPIGSFYGHSYILPWEWPAPALVSTTDENITTSTSSSLANDQPSILHELTVYMSLLEDIQCRYSLAATRLQSLLTQIELPHCNSGHTQYYLKRSKKPTAEDEKIQQAYADCMQLQLQMNIAQKAIERLQRAIHPAVSNNSEEAGTSSQQKTASSSANAEILRSSSTDKLRVLCELLLDSLLSTTYSTASIPQLPLSLYNVFTPTLCESLFQHLCVSGGTRKMQLYGGILLVRLCGNHAWWGDFLGNMLNEYFSLQQPLVFPQDR